MLETKIENIWFESSLSGEKVAGYIVTYPEVEPYAILQITHGMAEYWQRYRPFADFMARQGYVVCGHDHLGHGATSGDDTAKDGFFASKNGRDYVLKDIHSMTNLIHGRYPALPLILFGHSMGSFFARWAVESWPTAQNAAVFCGTGGQNPTAPVGLLLTRLIGAVHGPRYRSKFVDNLAFGSYQKRISQPKTSFDWLSGNEQNVADYIQDPKCGFLFSVSAFHEMMKLIQHVNTDAWAKSLPKAMPMLVVAGAEDPVGSYGAGPVEVAERMRKAGVQDVALKLYDGMRHEILNETDKQQVWDDLYAWCEQALHRFGVIHAVE
ncbi:alpha/beta fold hydrolase [Pygmaiobacter massiliensis]|uniref:alpha/beta fold hydrolase n=1 Tax=Pygmaiobacter massiliensis TaxID=1917873 RepID=UPI0028A29232|nr:alpha/beta fold hydrolase [Pygmaiobacter massiliensis]